MISGGVEVNQYTSIHLILEVKFGVDPRKLKKIFKTSISTKMFHLNLNP